MKIEDEGKLSRRQFSKRLAGLGGAALAGATGLAALGPAESASAASGPYTHVWVNNQGYVTSGELIDYILRTDLTENTDELRGDALIGMRQPLQLPMGAPDP